MRQVLIIAAGIGLLVLAVYAVSHVLLFINGGLVEAASMDAGHSIGSVLKPKGYPRIMTFTNPLGQYTRIDFLGSGHVAAEDGGWVAHGMRCQP